MKPARSIASVALLVSLAAVGCASDASESAAGPELSEVETDSERVAAKAAVRYHCAARDVGAVVPRFQFTLGRLNSVVRAEYITLAPGRSPVATEAFRDVAFRSPTGAAGSLKFRNAAIVAPHAPNDAWIVVDSLMATTKASGNALLYSANSRASTPFRYTCVQVGTGFTVVR